MTNPKTGEMRSDMKILMMPSLFRMPTPPCATAAPMRPPTRAWDELTGRPIRMVMRFQRMAESSAAMMTWSVMRHRVDDARADGLGHRGGEEGAEDVHERREDDGGARGQDLGRDDGGDGVGAVMPAVRDIEQHREDDDEDQDLRHVSGRCLRGCWRCPRPGPRRLRRAGRCPSI